MRGGCRENSGRKPKLDIWDRLAIGSECEKRFNQVWESAREDAWNSKDGVAEVRRIHREYFTVPISQRSAFHTTAEGSELRELAEQAIREVRKTPDFVEHTNRWFPVTAPRPKGVSNGICAEVAANFAEALDRPDIGLRYVRRCWDEYRRFRKDCQSDD